MFPLDAKTLLARAQRRVPGSFTSVIGDRFPHHVHAWCESLARTSLTRTGVMVTSRYLATRLENRLRINRYVAANPDVTAIPVERPIFILGLYRTGTTLLHNLLARHRGLRAPRTWELLYPAPLSLSAPNPSARRRRARLAFAASDRIAPDLKRAHRITADGPEECFFLQENGGVSTSVFHSFGGARYAFALLKEDLAPTYRFQRLQMQLMTHDAERRARAEANRPRWVMKCPFHLWKLDELLEVFPDAVIVHLHRDVGQAIASTASLSNIVTQKLVRDHDPRALGAFWAAFSSLGLERGLRTRKAHSSIIDVRMTDLVCDPVRVAGQIAQRAGLPTDPSFPSHANDVLQEREAARRRIGNHVYRAEDFGIDVETLRARHEDYTATFVEPTARHLTL